MSLNILAEDEVQPFVLSLRFEFFTRSHQIHPCHLLQMESRLKPVDIENFRSMIDTLLFENADLLIYLKKENSVGRV
jgi:hypothetical protein